MPKKSVESFEKNRAAFDLIYSPKIIYILINHELVKIRFSSREVKILHLLNNGLSNLEIADKIHIAPVSAKKALYRLYKKNEYEQEVSSHS